MLIGTVLVLPLLMFGQTTDAYLPDANTMPWPCSSTCNPENIEASFDDDSGAWVPSTVWVKSSKKIKVKLTKKEVDGKEHLMVHGVAEKHSGMDTFDGFHLTLYADDTKIKYYLGHTPFNPDEATAIAKSGEWLGAGRCTKKREKDGEEEEMICDGRVIGRLSFPKKDAVPDTAHKYEIQAAVPLPEGLTSIRVHFKDTVGNSFIVTDVIGSKGDPCGILTSHRSPRIVSIADDGAVSLGGTIAEHVGDHIEGGVRVFIAGERKGKPRTNREERSVCRSGIERVNAAAGMEMPTVRGAGQGAGAAKKKFQPDLVKPPCDRYEEQFRYVTKTPIFETVQDVQWVRSKVNPVAKVDEQLGGHLEDMNQKKEGAEKLADNGCNDACKYVRVRSDYFGDAAIDVDGWWSCQSAVLGECFAREEANDPPWRPKSPTKDLTIKKVTK